MTDRLRDLLDLVLGSLDDPRADGRALAERAHFSRDHLDRLVAAAAGETPVALRRRLLLERAAWQLRTGACQASDAAAHAGYGSLAAFSRSFSRAYGVPPSAFADAGTPVALPAPNGLHFHPPAGLAVPSAAADRGPGDVALRQLRHHLAHGAALLGAAEALPAEALARPLRPGFVACWFEGEEPSAALMAERLVASLEVWVAAIAGEELPEPGGRLLDRWQRAGRAFVALVRRARPGDGFVDALCEPPQLFLHGDVVAHVLEYGAVRRHALEGVLRELGADLPAALGDPAAGAP